MILRANCKINLGLDILARREDGFHDLETVMIPVKELYDTVEVEPTEGVSVFEQRGLVVDCDAESNLCMKALRLVQRLYGVGEVRITLDKRVPFGAGLGGGSSDATAVILALNELFKLGLSEDELVRVAAMIGSDTAFFVRNTPQLCSGRGEVMEPIELPLQGKYLAIAKPNEGVSTKEAYAGVRPFLPAVRLAEALKRPLAEWQMCVKNDFESHIFVAHPAIAELKLRMLAAGALYASMSGSGSAVFGIFESEPRLDKEAYNYLKITKL
jgi:4-diphosphocytidyl-2-C-methyl-D-erythritol kinase